MTHDARSVANLVLEEAQRRNLPVSNFVLQKLLFLAHAIFIVQKGKPLVRESFEAWQHGPVLREVYDTFKKWGKEPILEPAISRSPATGIVKPLPRLDDIDAVEIVSRVVSHYGNWNWYHLYDLTHAKGGPWDFVVEQSKSAANVGLRISDDVIRQRMRYMWKPLNEAGEPDGPEENFPFA